MLIPVIYFDHTHDLVEGISITSLIREGRIRAFKRASGWVNIGKDRIRRFDSAGIERVDFKNESGLPILQEAYS